MVSGQEFEQWYEQAQGEGIKYDVPLAELDWLLKTVIGLDSLSLRLKNFEKNTLVLNLPSLNELNQLWQSRLIKRVPIQYLAGVVQWRYFSLYVSPSVLIPRPETELMIDLAQSAFPPSEMDFSSRHWVDLGTGSGAIALGLADLFPQDTIHAVDLSAEALEIAQKNAKNLGFFPQIKFYQGSWWEPLQELQGKVTGMLANPPYIPTSLLPHLAPEVIKYEPISALDGGNDGLEQIRDLVENAPEYLQSGGLWLIEIMMGQGKTVTQLLENQGSYRDIEIIEDLAGLDRFVKAYRR